MDLHHLLLAGLPGALRVTPESGHRPIQSACLKSANKRLMHRSKDVRPTASLDTSQPPSLINLLADGRAATALHYRGVHRGGDDGLAQGVFYDGFSG